MLIAGFVTYTFKSWVVSKSSKFKLQLATSWINRLRLWNL